MNNEHKVAYQNEEINELRKENISLRAEIRVLEKEIKQRDLRIETYEKDREALKEACESIMSEYAEKIAGLAELQSTYETALQEMKGIKGKYKQEADKLIGSMKRQVRKAV